MTAAPQDDIDLIAVPSGSDGPDNDHNDTRLAKAELAESHRAFVREINEQMGRAYGFVGGAALLTVAIALTVGYLLGLLATVALWMVTLTLGLIALFIGRNRAYAHRRALFEKVRAYCEANAIDVDHLRAYYEQDELYPFFKALFEDTP